MPENLTNILPYNLEAEQSVLGSILIDPKCIDKVVSIIKPEYFYLPQNEEIFRIMQSKYVNSTGPIDPVIISNALTKSGTFDESNGRQYLVELVQIVPSSANVENYANIVREQYYLRTLIKTSRQIISDAEQQKTDVNDIIDAAEQRIYDIRSSNEVKGPRRIGDVIANDVYDNLQNITGENADYYKGIPSGFSKLDKTLSGLNRSDLILIGARPAMGKTSFALNLASNVALSAKKKVVFFSLEMTNQQLAERLLSSLSGVSSYKFRTGELSDDEWQKIGNAAGSFADVELYLDDSSAITVPEMKSRIRRLRNVDAVIIDYLGLITPATKSDNRVQQVQQITQQLKQMAKDLAIPVICCAQLSRGTEGRGKSHRPQLADLRESGSIEQDADIVLFLYRSDYYKGENIEEDIEESEPETLLIVAKNRHGETGDIKLEFDKEFTRFRSIEEPNLEEN